MSKIRSTLYLGVSRLITLLASVWALGRYYEWLGEEGWGAIALIALIGGLLVILGDLGLTNGTLNVMVKHLQAKEMEKADRVFVSHRLVVLLNGSLGCSIFFILYATHTVKGLSHDYTAALFFICAGIQLIISMANLGLNALLTAREEFAHIAKVQLLSSFANIGISLWLVHLTRQPWAFVFGNVVGAILTFGAFEYKAKRLGFLQHRCRVYAEEFKHVIQYLRRSLVGNLALVFTGADQFVVNHVLGQKALGIYDISTRLPATLTQTIPIGQVVQPELVKAHLEGEAQLSKTYERAMPVVLGIMMALLVIPSAFGEQILNILIDEYQPVMFPLFVAACFNSALMIYGGLFALTASGANKPQVAAPFIWLGTFGNGLFAIPAAIQFGLQGVAMSRVFIQSIQFYAMEVSIRNSVIPSLRLGRLLGLKLGIVATAGVFWILCFFLAKTSPVQSNPWLGILGAIISSYLYVAVITATRLIDLPVKLLKLFPFLPKPA